MTALPQAFLERMQEISTMDIDALCRSMTQPRVRALRVAACKTENAQVMQNAPCAAQVPWETGAYTLAEDFHGNDIAHRIGMYYVQEPSAMLPVAALDWKPYWRVLDLCAAPGGKTHQLACRLAEGFLLSNEFVPARARTLLSNVERTGISAAAVTNAAAQTLAACLPGVFDAVLVDAPCSGEGLFRRDPDAVQEWSPARSLGCSQRQLDILECADAMLREGGYLVYATCTFSVQENEQVVDVFLRRHPQYATCPASDAVCAHTAQGECVAGVSYTHARRYYPYFGMGEGQFLCVLQKQDGTHERPQRRDASIQQVPGDMAAAAKAFLKETIGESQQPIALWADTLTLLPRQTVALPHGVRTLRMGTALGTVYKGRFVPHHHFFSAFGRLFLQKLSFAPSDPRAAAYLRGEELDASGLSDGYAAVLIGGCAAGGVRIKKGRAKNLYPKGLRG